MSRWSGVATREGAKLVLRYVVEPGLLLRQTRKDLCCITFRLSIMRSSARESHNGKEKRRGSMGKIGAEGSSQKWIT